MTRTMGPTTNNRRKRRPRLLDRVELRLSRHKFVDRLWVGTYEQEPDSVLRRVEEALNLIKAYDRLSYDRITRDFQRVWMRTLFMELARFTASIHACELYIR